MAAARSQIDIIVADLFVYTEEQVIELTLDLTSSLQEVTPRDLGWARANWVPSIGTPDPLPQPKDPQPGDVARAAAKAQSNAADLLSYTLDQGSTFVSNGVPYIGRLNDGWSKQAPAGFVQAEIQAALDRAEVRRR